MTKKIQMTAHIAPYPDATQGKFVMTEFTQMVVRAERDLKNNGVTEFQHGMEVLWDPQTKTVFISPITKRWPPRFVKHESGF